MSIRNVQIEEKKIDHASVKKAIGKISQDPGKKKRQRKITPTIRCSCPQQEAQNNHKRNKRNSDEKGVVASERSKCCTRIGYVNQAEKIGHQNTRLIRTDEPQNHLLGPLIQCVERNGDKQNELHVFQPVVSRRAKSKHR